MKKILVVVASLVIGLVIANVALNKAQTAACESTATAHRCALLQSEGGQIGYMLPFVGVSFALGLLLAFSLPKPHYR